MLIDTHAHLTDVKLVQSLADVLVTAHNEGVEKIITIGTSLADSKQAVELAQRHSEIYAGVGVYPDEDQDLSIGTISTNLSNLASQSKIVGIGETGIDIPKEGAPFDLSRQLELFEAHIEMSIATRLPLIVHNRGADALVYNTLIKYKNKLQGGVFHCYTGDSEFAKKIISLGFYISFSGILTYKNSEAIQGTAHKIPTDRILIETDAPYLTPHPYRGQICEPKHVKITANKLAELLNLTTEKVEEITYNNAVSLFPLLGKTI